MEPESKVAGDAWDLPQQFVRTVLSFEMTYNQEMSKGL